MVDQEILALEIAERAVVMLGGTARVVQAGPRMCRIADQDRGVWVGLTVRYPRVICRAGRIAKAGGWSDAIGHSMLIPNAGNIGDVVTVVQQLWRRFDEA